jgi:hypothetical protein
LNKKKRRKKKGISEKSDRNLVCPDTSPVFKKFPKDKKQKKTSKFF